MPPVQGDVELPAADRRDARPLDHLLFARAGDSVALGAASCVLGAGGLHVYAFERGEARQPGEDIGKFLLEVGPVTPAHCPGKLPGFLDQPAERAIPASPAVFVEVDVTDETLEFGDGQRVSMAKKRGESSKPPGADSGD
jgi:hypothetical protein